MVRHGLAVLAAAWMTTLLACSSSSGGGSGSGPGGGVTFSCNASAANLCTQLLVPSSEVSSEASSCMQSEMGTPGTGCPTTGLVGCCKFANNDADEEQCYYSATAASAGMSVCTSMKGTWGTTL
jgi:hypothetical protein